MSNGKVLNDKIDFSILHLRFQIYVNLSSALTTNFKNFRAAISLPISKQYIRLGLLFSNHSSFSHNLNYAKKHERGSDVKRW